MGDIVQYLIIIGAIVIGLASQGKKKRKRVDEEAFPPIFEYEEEEEYSEKRHPEPLAATVPAQPATRARHKQGMPHTVSATPPQATVPEAGNAPRISLNSAQKAREAFIYSEIFTRKYQ